MIDRQMIYDLRDRIVQKFQPHKIVLFGSYAYGNPSPDSDVDMLVILSFEGKSAQKAVNICKTFRQSVRQSLGLHL